MNSSEIQPSETNSDQEQSGTNEKSIVTAIRSEESRSTETEDSRIPDDLMNAAVNET
ncbi:MAG: hypothetical protein H0T62_12515 [Parachlamydiaceae bacterium]|nr:hypothetical protein [Parachlamydiaceae bacterium]